MDSDDDGIDVDGTISADWATVCRRCLADVSGLPENDAALWPG